MDNFDLLKTLKRISFTLRFVYFRRFKLEHFDLIVMNVIPVIQNISPSLNGTMGGHLVQILTFHAN